MKKSTTIAIIAGAAAAAIPTTLLIKKYITNKQRLKTNVPGQSESPRDENVPNLTLLKKQPEVKAVQPETFIKDLQTEIKPVVAPEKKNYPIRDLSPPMVAAYIILKTKTISSFVRKHN